MQNCKQDEVTHKKESYRLKDKPELNEEESIELLSEIIANRIIDQILAYEAGKSANEGIVATES
ncbi:MAG: hypothetical protein KGO81_13450 [Bacteroidota bacterium]|nr:hypothetical protein [Bacteroidota bacterium]